MAEQEWRTSTRSLRRLTPAEPYRASPRQPPDRRHHPHRDPRLRDLAQPVKPKALSPKTVEGVYRRLVSILEAAVFDRRITPHSPAIRIKLPKVTKQATDNLVVLDLDDVRRIADAAPRWLTALTWTIATAGLRPRRSRRPHSRTASTSCAAKFTSTANSRPSSATPPTPPRAKPGPRPSSHHPRPQQAFAPSPSETHSSPNSTATSPSTPPVEMEPGATLLFSNRNRQPAQTQHPRQRVGHHPQEPRPPTRSPRLALRSATPTPAG